MPIISRLKLSKHMVYIKTAMLGQLLALIPQPFETPIDKQSYVFNITVLGGSFKLATNIFDSHKYQQSV